MSANSSMLIGHVNHVVRMNGLTSGPSSINGPNAIQNGVKRVEFDFARGCLSVFEFNSGAHGNQIHEYDLSDVKTITITIDSNYSYVFNFSTV